MFGMLQGGTSKEFLRIEEVALDEMATKLETSLFMVYCLSTNIASGVGWYLDIRVSKHITFN
jgi:hypothetical protein